MNVLVTLDENYVPPLRVMLTSLFLNHPKRPLTIYLMHRRISEASIQNLKQLIESHGATLEVIEVDGAVFANQPIRSYLTVEMYYRLLAPQILPAHVDRILYLDPDILVLQSLESLYNLDLNGKAVAAAHHDRIWTHPYNRLRYKPIAIDYYFNSGVLLMDLKKLKSQLTIEKIEQFIQQFRHPLFLPDQDILNGVLAKQIYPLDEKIYNYDARHYRFYWWRTLGKFNLKYILHHTAILHFNGRQKPWLPNYKGIFSPLYQSYRAKIDVDQRVPL